MPQIASIGEVMIELAPAGSDADKELKALSFAGDSYNTVVTLARLGVNSAYVTRLGEDAYSNEIVQRLRNEEVDTGAITRSASAMPGLYMIHNAPDGEREFLYWRDQSAARQLFEDDQRNQALSAYFAQCEWLYLSGISLAVMSDEAREKLLALLHAYKANGGKIAFDSNYRPRLWASAEKAQQANMAVLAITDLALLTLDDEELLWGSKGNPLSEANTRYAELSIDEIVYKRGADDVIIVNGNAETRVAVKRVENVVDTTAAGDTFNADYLASRLLGGSAIEAAREGNRCAGVIIQHRGGVIDKATFMNHRAEFTVL